MGASPSPSGALVAAAGGRCTTTAACAESRAARSVTLQTGSLCTSWKRHFEQVDSDRRPEREAQPAAKRSLKTTTIYDERRALLIACYIAANNELSAPARFSGRGRRGRVALQAIVLCSVVLRKGLLQVEAFQKLVLGSLFI